MSDFLDDRRIETMFPEKEDVDYSLLKLTPEGEYSITRRADGKRLLQKIILVSGDPRFKSIVDLTGNVGGDTILFGMHFESVMSFEIQEDNYKALKHNIQTYNLQNTRAYLGDSTELFNWKTDIAYIDPPWGGPDYKLKDNIDLFLGTQRLDEYLTFLLIQFWRPDYIFLKLPKNYNFSRLSDLPNIKKQHMFPIRSFFLVALEVSEFYSSSVDF